MTNQELEEEAQAWAHYKVDGERLQRFRDHIAELQAANDHPSERDLLAILDRAIEIRSGK